MAQMTIDQKDLWSNDIRNLFGSDFFSDVTVIVNGQRFAAHKTILASRSEYFRNLFGSGMVESTQREITIDEPNAEIFEKLLRYIYTGQVTLPMSIEGDVLELLRLSNKYLFLALEASIVDRLQAMITAQNFFSTYGAAWFYSAKLKAECFKFMDLHAEEVLDNDDGFATLTVDAAVELVDCSILKHLQMRLWQAFLKWVQSNGREHANSLLSRIILAQLPITFLLESVRPSGLFSDAALLGAIADVQGIASTEAKPAPAFGGKNADVQFYFVLPGGKVVPLQESRPMDFVSNLKWVLAMKEGMSSGDLELSYLGKPLDKYRRVQDCGIKNGSILYASVKSRQ